MPAIAEGELRSRIELSDAAFVIDRHNAVKCRVQDRGLSCLTAPQLLLCPLPVIDISICPIPFDDLAGFIA